MFGTINNKQNIINNNNKNCGKLLNNPKFVAVPTKISEEVLFILIKKYYDNKDKEKLLECCDVYQKYKYEKYLDIIHQYIDEFK